MDLLYIFYYFMCFYIVFDCFGYLFFFYIILKKCLKVYVDGIIWIVVGILLNMVGIIERR